MLPQRRCVTLADYDEGKWTPKDEEPETPFVNGITDLQVSAVSLHEWVLSLQSAGFTRSESIHIVVELIKSAPHD